MVFECENVDHFPRNTPSITVFITKYLTRASRSNTGTVERLRMERILREQNERSRRDRMMAERAKKGTVRAAREARVYYSQQK